VKIINRTITITGFSIFVLLTILCSTQSTCSASARDVMVVSGLPGFQALAYGENRLSLAVVPLAQQGGQLSFRVTGLAASSPGNDPAVIYTLSEPMAGVFDPSQKTLQIDLTNFNTAASEGEQVDVSRVNNVLRTSANTTIIEVAMDYKSLQGSEAKFRVSSISLIPPDGQTQTYRLELPKQLIIDGDTKRLSMV
jgi:hypothetical protein